jgi:hypothetical protein
MWISQMGGLLGLMANDSFQAKAYDKLLSKLTKAGKILSIGVDENGSRTYTLRWRKFTVTVKEGDRWTKRKPYFQV